ncbi:MAG: hypothetical protein AB7Q16_19360 [Vicinamibacterales bacterium]
MDGRRKAVCEAAAYVALFLYVFWFRTHGVEEGFLLLGDQVRDWDVARRRFIDLPLVGAPSSAGGVTLGPAYYWVLWLIARTAGPLVDNLPHAGGLGISLLQSQADIVLAWALVRRTGSLPVALAIVLLGATSVFDAMFSSTIWNPPVAVALLKLALALVLVGPAGSLHLTAAVTVCAWCAVHAHTSSILVALPLMAWAVLVPPGDHHQPRPRGAHLAVAGGTVVLLQVPWLAQTMITGLRYQSQITESIAVAARSPLSGIRGAASAEALAGQLSNLLFFPAPAPWFPLALAAGVLATLVVSRDLRLLASGPAPLAVGCGAFALWQGSYERYWMLVLVPSTAICLLAWAAALTERSRAAVGIGALAIVIVLQPARFERVRTTDAHPGYGALVRGCRQVASEGHAVAAIASELPVATGSPLWLCSILGVSLEEGAEERAVIDAAGVARYEAVR